MLDRFVIVDFGSPRPAVDHVIFCDGAGGDQFRVESDLDLSHWRPNRTPARYRAGTSTEICFRFLDAPLEEPWTAAVNNHLDVDGLLSIYVLLHSHHACQHRETVIAAAEMGDFRGWGEVPAQRLFQGLTWLMRDRSAAGVSVQSVYEEAFDRVPGLIAGTDSQVAAIDASLAPLRHGVELVEQKRIDRTLCAERLAHYVIPTAVTAGTDDRTPFVPEFNAFVTAELVLSPHVRARWDRERLTLVSTESQNGWHHELWAPGYLWADTTGLWQVPGLDFGDSMEGYTLEEGGFTAACRRLQEVESAAGVWSMGDRESKWSERIQGAFPVIARFLGPEGTPVQSRLPPEVVCREFTRGLLESVAAPASGVEAC